MSSPEGGATSQLVTEGAISVALAAYLAGITLSEAARRLTKMWGAGVADSRQHVRTSFGGGNQNRRRAASAQTKVPIIPVPSNVPPCRFRHPIHGAPTGKWSWHDIEGELVAYTMRFDYEKDGKPKKEVLPVTYCEVTAEDRVHLAWRSCWRPSTATTLQVAPPMRLARQAGHHRRGRENGGPRG